jgi:glycosidase
MGYYKKLLKLRAAYPALWAAGIEEVPLPGSKSLIAFQRRKTDEQFVIVLNLSNTDESADINLNGYNCAVDVLMDKEFKCNDQSGLAVNIPVGAHGIRWLLLKKKA